MARAAERNDVNDREEPDQIPGGALRESLESTRREAAPFAIMTGLTDPFMIPYALALGASAQEAGFLSTLRTLILSLVQIWSVDAIHRAGSRKRVVLWAVGLQAILWIPLALVGPLFGPYAVAALILLYTLATATAAFGGPAWGSMVSEYLPPERRGRFFGRREMIVGTVAAAIGILGSVLLETLSGRLLLGFGLLCGGAAISRGVSWMWLNRLHDGPWHEPPEARVSLPAFLRRAARDNFPRFAVSLAVFNFSVNLVVPYLTVYMLDELRYGYVTYAIIVLSGAMVGNLMIPSWGKVADRRGNRVVMRWTMLGAALLPLLWPLLPAPGWLLALHLVGGCLWGGLNLTAVNFVYDAAPPPARARALAFLNVINGCGIALGTLAGGGLLRVLPEIRGSTFVTLFLISGALRLGATVLFDRAVREVRDISQTGLREVVMDLVGQRVVQVFGYFSARPVEASRPAASRGPGREHPPPPTGAGSDAPPPASL